MAQEEELKFGRDSTALFVTQSLTLYLIVQGLIIWIGCSQTTVQLNSRWKFTILGRVKKRQGHLSLKSIGPNTGNAQTS